MNREVRTNKIDRINQPLRAVSLVNLVASGNRENQMRKRTREGVLTQKKEGFYVSSDQEEQSVKATEVNLAEVIRSVANHLKGGIPR
jgi:predicted phosphatase